MYDSKLRRFLSPDKMKEQYGSYSYVGNNPVSFIDPDGRVKIYPLTKEAYLEKNGPAMMKQRLDIVDELLKKIREKIPYQGNMRSGIIDSKGESYLKQRFYLSMIDFIDGENKDNIFTNEPHLGAALSKEIGVANCDQFMNVSYSELVEEFWSTLKNGSCIWNNYQIARVQSNMGHSFVVLEYIHPKTKAKVEARSIVVDPWVIENGGVILTNAAFSVDNYVGTSLHISDQSSLIKEVQARNRENQYIEDRKAADLQDGILDINMTEVERKDNMITYFLNTNKDIKRVFEWELRIKHDLYPTYFPENGVLSNNQTGKLKFGKLKMLNKNGKEYNKMVTKRLKKITKKALDPNSTPRMTLWDQRFAHNNVGDNIEYVDSTNKCEQ